VAEKVLPLPHRRGIDLARVVPSGRSLAIGAALVLATAGLYALARETSMFAVRYVEVHGATTAVATQVRRALAGYDGRSLVALDPDAMTERLNGLPTVLRSSVDRAFPHTLRVRVVPELPVAVLRRGTGSWLVSAGGRVIGSTARGAHRVLPRIWLSARAHIEVGARLDDEPAGVAARSLALFLTNRFPGAVAFVRAQAPQVSIGLRDGLEIRLGGPVDVSVKIAVARSILPMLAAPDAGGPDYLDVSAPERPVVGRNPQPSA
jgi:cell division protein FtsQ